MIGSLFVCYVRHTYKRGGVLVVAICENISTRRVPSTACVGRWRDHACFSQITIGRVAVMETKKTSNRSRATRRTRRRGLCSRDRAFVDLACQYSARRTVLKYLHFTNFDDACSILFNWASGRCLFMHTLTHGTRCLINDGELNSHQTPTQCRSVVE